MAIEIESLGEPVWRALDLLIFRGETTEVIDAVEQAPPENAVVEAIWNHLLQTQPDMLE